MVKPFCINKYKVNQRWPPIPSRTKESEMYKLQKKEKKKVEKANNNSSETKRTLFLHCLSISFCIII